MFYYSPIDNEVFDKWIKYNPRSCFIMTQLGDNRDKELKQILVDVRQHLKKKNLQFLNANSYITGKDFLNKIWRISISVPIGIAIVTRMMGTSTISNIFYEIGLMNALGKETIIIKGENFEVPSNLIRTEWINYMGDFEEKFNKFLDTVFEQADYYATMADNLVTNPLLGLDYLRRAYLIIGEKSHQKRAQEIMDNNDFEEHTTHMINSFIKN